MEGTASPKDIKVMRHMHKYAPSKLKELMILNEVITYPLQKLGQTFFPMLIKVA